MNDPIKLLFDEGIGRPMMEKMCDLVRITNPNVEFKHLLDFQKEGVADRIWIPQYAKDGWVLVSTDRHGKSSKGDGGNLPLLCRGHKMTHVLLGTAVHKMNQERKSVAILSVWPEIQSQAVPAPPGSRFIIRKFGERIKLEARPYVKKNKTAPRVPKLRRPDPRSHTGTED